MDDDVGTDEAARRYYIEHDGRVLVVRHEGRVVLPALDEVDVPFSELARRTLHGHEVVFGNAELDEHPTHWPSKDALAVDAEAGLDVRAAINASLYRPVVGVVVRHGDDVLLVEPARGVATGHWTLPGGFLGAFEHPQDGARREVREEVGLELEELALQGTMTYEHPGSPYPILGLAFTATATSRDVTVREEEIRVARWFSVAQASERSGGLAGRVLSYLAREGLL